MSIRWGLSVLDWRDHAIDDSRDHPIGVYRARDLDYQLLIHRAGSRDPRTSEELRPVRRLSGCAVRTA
jgi:hypothetical protein